MEEPDLTTEEFEKLKKNLTPSQRNSVGVRLTRRLKDGTIQYAVPCEGGYKFVNKK